MERRQFLTAAGSVLAGRQSRAAAAKPLAFRYAEVKPTETQSAVRSHRIHIAPASGVVHVYCTFTMGGLNPIPCPDGQARGPQIVTLGASQKGRLVPATRFGLQDGKGAPGGAHLVPWVSDGQIDHY